MEAVETSAKSPKTEIFYEDWTVVLPRRRKKEKRSVPKTITPQEPWSPSYLETDPALESSILQKIELSTRKLENSKFYLAFIEQLESPQLVSHIHKVLAPEKQFQMVIYGIGSIESYGNPRIQLALALLLKRKFDWIGKIEVFDPVLTAVECSVLERLGCKVLLVNEQGRREILRPTLFFMPYCEKILYDNLLEANWSYEHLNRLVIFGNSFAQYHKSISQFNCFAESAHYLLYSRLFVEELAVENISEEFFRAFHDMSWHFFDVDPSVELKRL